MAHRRLLWGSICMGALWIVSAAATDVSIQFDIQPRALRVGEAAVGSLTVRGLENFSPPNFPPIDGMQISLVGTERSFSLGAGGTDVARIYRYRFVPLRVGEFQIGPFTYRFNGRNVELPAITLHVVDPSSSAEREEATSGNLLFAMLDVSPTNLFSQQVFDLIIRIYSADGINLGREISLMNFSPAGLTLQPFQELGTDRVVHNNRIYNVRRFVAKATALTSGSVTLAPTLRAQVITPHERRRSQDPFFDYFGGSIFDEFFGRVQSQTVDLPISEVVVNIQPLPEDNKPALFSGAVGRFDFRVDVKPLACAAGDPVTINFGIVGEGNIEHIGPPAWNPDERWRVYEPKLVSKDIQAANATGRLLYEQVVIPKTEGDLELPAIEFSYFDPVEAQYRTRRQGPFIVKVKSATNLTAKVVQAPISSSSASPKIIGSDIVYLKPYPKRWLSTKNPSFYRRRIFWAAQSIPLTMVIVAAIVQRRRYRTQTDAAWARRARAPRAARAGLRLAEKARKRNDRIAFFEAIYKTLGNYFGNRFNLPPGALTSAEVLQRLRAAGFDDSRCADLEHIYQRCEELRYAGAIQQASSNNESSEMLDFLRRVEDTLEACERLNL